MLTVALAFAACIVLTQAINAAVIRGLLADAKADRTAHAEQVAALCQRLQAPQAAALEHAIRNHDGPRDLDPLSDQETVEQQDAEMARLAVEAIEAREAELAELP
jgi:hypothetical protein